MTRNFIIQYLGREGSSAIISALSAQNGVNVPLFEELDGYQFLEKHRLADYPHTLDEIFTSGRYNEAQDLDKYLQKKANDAKIETTGFKWRVNGDISDIAKVLSRHNVRVFTLHRRDFLSIVCSFYIHTYGNELQSAFEVPRHPQFKKAHEPINGANPDQRDMLSQQHFPLNKKLFLAAAKQAVNNRKAQAGMSRRLTRLGLATKTIFYEDFDANPEEFITGILADIGLNIRGAYSPFCGFNKVHKTPLTERIDGLEKITKSFRFRYFKKEYAAAIQATSALSA